MLAMVGGLVAVWLFGGGTGRGSCTPSQSWVQLAAALLAALRWSRPDRPARRG